MNNWDWIYGAFVYIPLIILGLGIGDWLRRRTIDRTSRRTRDGESRGGARRESRTSRRTRAREERAIRHAIAAARARVNETAARRER